MKFNPLIPELYISEFDKSFNFYVNILRFKLEYQRVDSHNSRFAFLSYYGAQLMIKELYPEQNEKMQLEYPFGRGINFEIDTPDILELLDNLKKHTYPITKDLEEKWRDVGVKDKVYGSKEFRVNDPDGYLLRFSQDLGEKSVIK